MRWFITWVPDFRKAELEVETNLPSLSSQHKLVLICTSALMRKAVPAKFKFMLRCAT